jgi:hypothetical protein
MYPLTHQVTAYSLLSSSEKSPSAVHFMGEEKWQHAHVLVLPVKCQI